VDCNTFSLCARVGACFFPLFICLYFLFRFFNIIFSFFIFYCKFVCVFHSLSAMLVYYCNVLFFLYSLKSYVILISPFNLLEAGCFKKKNI
jgi:hypothetical protein